MSYTTEQILQRVNMICDESPYVILKSYFAAAVTLINIDKLIVPSKRNGLAIFQTIEHNDKLRLQLSGVACKDKQVSFMTMQIINLMENIGGGSLILSPVSILLSLAGCMAQELHHDFNMMEKTIETKQSYLIIASLMPKTKLTVFTQNKEKTINMNEGDLFIGRGDLIHAGAAYDIDNVRLHWYADYPDNGRREGKTYLYNKITDTTTCSDFYHRYIESRQENAVVARAKIVTNKQKKARQAENLKKNLASKVLQSQRDMSEEI